MRKIFAITLLALLGLALVQPLLAMTGKSEANLPACCRRNGIHRCIMSAAERGQYASRDPRFQTPHEKCPFSPHGIVIVHDKIFVAPTAQAIFAELIAHPAIAAQTESKLRISRNRSRQKRGPPSFSLAIS